MSNIVEILSDAAREDAIRAVQEVIPECVQAAVGEVGEEAFKAFFDGYKVSIDSMAIAA